MAKLNESSKKLISEIHPALVATASKNGKPNVSAKGSLRVLDDEHLIFAEISSPRTLANLKENPQINVFVLDPVKRSSCRIWGLATVENQGEKFEKLSNEYSARNLRVKNVVIISISDVQNT